jgi:hypothetical protein
VILGTLNPRTCRVFHFLQFSRKWQPAKPRTGMSIVFLLHAYRIFCCMVTSREGRSALIFCVFFVPMVDALIIWLQQTFQILLVLAFPVRLNGVVFAKWMYSNFTLESIQNCEQRVSIANQTCQLTKMNNTFVLLLYRFMSECDCKIEKNHYIFRAACM